jgi:hypothetical protein
MALLIGEMVVLRREMALLIGEMALLIGEMSLLTREMALLTLKSQQIPRLLRKFSHNIYKTTQECNLYNSDRPGTTRR